MGQISNTELIATKQDLVTSIVQMTLKEKAKLIPTIADYSSMAVKGAKSVAVPRRTQFTPEDKAENTGLTAQEMSFAVDTINLDKKKAIKADIELLESIQSAVNVEAHVIQEMADELALQVDRDIISQLRLASAAGPDHIVIKSGDPKADIIEARKLLKTQNVPMSDVWIGAHPDDEAEILAVSQFTQADTYGSPAGLRTGELNQGLYGFNLICHTGFSSGEYVFWHKSAVGYANQMQPMFKRDEDLTNVADEFLLAMVYGVKVLDAGKRQVLFNATGT